MEFTTGGCPPYFISRSECYLEKTHEQPQKLLVLDPRGTPLMELLTKAAEGVNLGITLPPGLVEALAGRALAWHAVHKQSFQKITFQKP